MFEKKFFFIINLLMKTKINILIDNFVKKILEIENSSNNLENKINSINELLNNLLDFCIKKKIYFYIENNIGYNKIINLFKFHLIKFIQKLIDPSDNLVSKYIQKLNENLDNYSDINSLLFKKFKSEEMNKDNDYNIITKNTNTTKNTNKSTNKNINNKSNNKNTNNDNINKSKKSVSICEDIDIIGYDNNEGFSFNHDNISDNDSFSKLFPKTFDNVKSILVNNKSKKLSKILNSDEDSSSNDSNQADSSDKSDGTDESDESEESEESNDSKKDKSNESEQDNSNNSDQDKKINNNLDGLFDYEQNNKLGLYIKVLLSQNKHIIEFVEKVNYMCKIISDPEIKFNLDNPFE